MESAPSRLKWLLLGSFARAPVIYGLKYVGTNMAASTSFFVLRMLGSAILFICSVAELNFEGPDADDDPNDTTTPTVPLEPTPLPRVQLRQESAIPIPTSWKHRGASDVTCHLVPAEPFVVSAIEAGLRATAHDNCVGRDGTGKTKRAKVLSVHRIENRMLWKQYWHRRNELIDEHHAYNVRVQPLNPAAFQIAIDQRKQFGTPAERAARYKMNGPIDEDGLVDAKLNELFLYHGTSAAVADTIIPYHGFDERVGAMGGLYGAGTYFANQSCKAGQYATADNNGVKSIIIARVVLGDPFYATGMMRNERRPPNRNNKFAPGLTWDSVIANSAGSQIHREFILYGHNAVAYPEYVVKYKEQ